MRACLLGPAVLGAALLLGLSTAPPAAPGSAPVACWKRLLNDWYDGKLDHTYPLPCYHEAVRHIPPTVQLYTSAKDDILRALAAAADGRPPPGEDAPPAQADGPSGGREPGHLLGFLPGGVGSLPLPLIVLGALAILLTAGGGAGMIWRRSRSGEPDSR